MIYGVYSIKDLKTGFLFPQYDYNDDSATRAFVHACKNTDSLFYTHYGDYQLWKVGDFNTETGVFDINDFRFICDAPIPEED